MTAFKMDVHTDLFPAVVAISPPNTPQASIYTQTRVLEASGGKKVEKVRVIASSTHLLIFDDGPEGPRLIYNKPIAAFAKAKRLSHRINDETRSMHPESTVMLEDGTTVAFYKQNGCGCGSRLKSFNPFRTLQQLAAS